MNSRLAEIKSEVNVTTQLNIPPVSHSGSAALIGYDEPFNPPEWIDDKFREANVEFDVRNCRTDQEVLEFARDRQVLITSSARKLVTAQILDSLACDAIVRIGSGVDCIDIPAATAHGVLVVNTPDALAEEVSDHAAALLLSCIRRVTDQDRQVRQGHWRSISPTSVPRLKDKTLGFIGFGRIARMLATKLKGFNLHYLVYDPYIDNSLVEQLGARLVSLDDLLRGSDFVSLHLPLSKETFHLIAERELALLKPRAVLVNTARGGVIDQAALARALQEGRFAAAGLDVFEQEPISPDDPLLGLGNVTITPHTASSSDQVMDSLFRAGAEVTIGLLRGKLPGSVVNPEVLKSGNLRLVIPAMTNR